jgi:hypothetical protein
VIKGWYNSFLSFLNWHREAPTISFGLRQKKRGLQLSKIKRENHGIQQEVAEKRKEIRWGGVHAAKSYFLIQRGRIPAFSDDPVPLFNFLKTNLFPSNFIFD